MEPLLLLLDFSIFRWFLNGKKKKEAKNKSCVRCGMEDGMRIGIGKGRAYNVQSLSATFPLPDVLQTKNRPTKDFSQMFPLLQRPYSYFPDSSSSSSSSSSSRSSSNEAKNNLYFHRLWQRMDWWPPSLTIPRTLILFYFIFLRPAARFLCIFPPVTDNETFLLLSSGPAIDESFPSDLRRRNPRDLDVDQTNEWWDQWTDRERRETRDERRKGAPLSMMTVSGRNAADSINLRNPINMERSFPSRSFFL